MQWVSDELGLLGTFWSEFIDPDPRWRPVGTRSEPFVEIEQGWLMEIWEDGQYVHVHHGGRRVLLPVVRGGKLGPPPGVEDHWQVA